MVYPVLADGADPVCEFEQAPEDLADRLEARGIYAVEFIPTRNDPETLTRYTDVFDARGFFQTAGTEHNSPAQPPLTGRNYTQAEAEFKSQKAKIGRPQRPQRS